MDKLFSFFTKENITFLIAIIGFLLSLYNFFRELLHNRMNLHIVYKNHCVSAHDHCGVTISLSIENKTKIPISISRAFLNIDETSLEFYWIPQLIFRSTHSINKAVYDEVNVHSIALPVHIEGYGVIGGFFFCKSSVPINSEKLLSAKTSITIHSNKGIKTYPISMNNTSLEY